MAPNLSPAFAYTVVYVQDVAKSVAFYSNAFGYSVRRLDESHKSPFFALHTIYNQDLGLSYVLTVKFFQMGRVG